MCGPRGAGRLGLAPAPRPQIPRHVRLVADGATPNHPARRHGGLKHMSPTGTKQRPRRPAARTRTAPTRGSTQGRPAHARRRAPARRPASPRQQAPPAFAKVAATIGRHINRQRHDVTAAALLFFAVIAALGLFAGAAGPVGRGLAWLCRALLGWTPPGLPVLLAWIAGEVSRSRTQDAGR